MHKILLKTSLTAVAVMILAAGGCSGETQTPVTVTATPTPTATAAPTATPAPFVSEVVARYEAEDAKLNGKVSVVTMKGSQQVSGEAYVKGFENDGDSCTFTVNAPEDGFYNLIFKQQGISGEKTNFVSLDGEYIGSITVDGVMLRETPFERVYLSKGSHKVSVYNVLNFSVSILI